MERPPGAHKGQTTTIATTKRTQKKDSGTFMTKIEGTTGMNVKISLIVLSLIHHDHLHVSQH